MRRFDDLIQRMADEEFDLVAVGRALLQDPEWAVKVKQGRLDEMEEYNRASISKLY